MGILPREGSNRARLHDPRRVRARGATAGAGARRAGQYVAYAGDVAARPVLGPGAQRSTLSKTREPAALIRLLENHVAAVAMGAHAVVVEIARGEVHSKD